MRRVFWDSEGNLPGFEPPGISHIPGLYPIPIIYTVFNAHHTPRLNLRQFLAVSIYKMPSLKPGGPHSTDDAQLEKIYLLKYFADICYIGPSLASKKLSHRPKWCRVERYISLNISGIYVIKITSRHYSKVCLLNLPARTRTSWTRTRPPQLKCPPKSLLWRLKTAEFGSCACRRGGMSHAPDYCPPFWRI